MDNINKMSNFNDICLFIILMVFIFLPDIAKAEDANEIVFGRDLNFKGEYLQLNSPVRSIGSVDFFPTVTSKWNQPRSTGSNPHQGIDLAVKRYTDIYSIASGIVRGIYQDDPNSETNLSYVVVELDLDQNGVYDNIFFIAAHLETVAVEEGDIVENTTIIGTSGKAYNSEHLHWGISHNFSNTAADRADYGNLIWYPIHKYYQKGWNGGKDLDLLNSLSYDPITCTVSINVYPKGTEQITNVDLFCRVKGTSVWKGPLPMIKGVDSFYSVSLKNYYVNNDVEILIRATRDLSVYKWAFFPAKYYQPPSGNPNSVGYSMDYYTVKVQNYEPISLGTIVNIEGITGTTKNYQFTLNTTEVVAVQTLPYTTNCDTTVAIYDANNSLIASDDNSGYDFYSYLKKKLAPGTYSIKVQESGNNAPLNCKLSLKADNIAYETIGTDVIRGIDLPAGSTKTFQLSLLNAPYTMETTQLYFNCDTELLLYDLNWNKMAMDDDNGYQDYSQIFKEINTGGTYYLEIRESRHDQPLRCRVEVSKISPLTLESNQNINQSDYIGTFKIVVPSTSSGTYSIDMNCPSGSDIYLFNAAGNELGSCLNSTDSYSTIVSSLSGTNYLVIREKGHDGSLKGTLSVRMAESVGLGEKKITALPAGSVKTYLFNSPAGGRYSFETFLNMTECDTEITLYDLSYNKKAFNDNGGYDLYAKYVGYLSPGTYIIKIRENGNNENLSSSLMVLPVEYLRSGEVKSAYVSERLSKTYYLAINYTGKYSIDTSRYGATCNTIIELYDSNWNKVTENDNKNFFEIYSKIIINLTSGYYYLVVRESGNDAALNCYLGVQQVDPIGITEIKTIDLPKGAVKTFSFHPTNPGIYSLETAYYSSNCDTIFNILDSNLVRVTTDDDDGYGLYSKIIQNLAVEDYFIEVMTYGDSQNLNTRLYLLQVEDLPLLINKGVSVPVGFSKTFKVVIDTLDGYKFKTDYLINECNTQLFLFDSTFANRGFDEDGGVGRYSAINKMLDRGEYYLEVRETNNNVLLNCNVSLTLLPDISLNSLFSMDSYNRSQVYHLNLTTATQTLPYLFETAENTVPTDTYIVLNYNDFQIGVDYDSGIGLYSRLFKDLYPDHYLLEIGKNSENAALNYKLNAQIVETIKINEAKNLSINSGFSKVFGFTPDITDTYIIETSYSSADTMLYLYDNNWVEICSDNDSGFGVLSKINQVLNAGQKYYIEIRDSSNKNSVNCSIKVRQMEQIGVNSIKSIYSLVNSSNESFKLHISNPGYYLIETSMYKTVCDTILYLYDQNWSEIESDDNDGLANYSKILRYLNPGDYYLHIKESGEDANLNCILSVNTVEEINIGERKAINQEKPKIYHLSIAADNLYTLETSYYNASADTLLEIYNSAYYLLESDDDDGYGAYSMIVSYLTSGDYFIEVQGLGTILNCYFCVTAGSTSPEELEVNGPSKSIALPQGMTKEYVVNVDYQSTYIFETAYNSNFCDTELYLYDASYIQISSDDNGGGGNYAKLAKVLTPGTYYLEVKEKYLGPLNFTITAWSDSTIYEEIVINEAKYIYNLRGPLTYRVSITQAGNYNIGTFFNNYECDTILTVMDLNRNILAQNDNSGGSNFSEIYTFLPAGDYLILLEEGTGMNLLDCVLLVSY